MVTEFVKFNALETITDEELLAKTDALNDFQKKQDGFIDAELEKDLQGNGWCLVYHYESMEKVKAIGEKMRACKVFDDFIPITVPGSISVSFHIQLKKW